MKMLMLKLYLDGLLHFWGNNIYIKKHDILPIYHKLINYYPSLKCIDCNRDFVIVFAL